MGLVGGVWLIIMAVVGAFVAGRGPGTPKSIFGWLIVIGGLGIGFISGLWGVWGVLSSLLSIGWLSKWPLFWTATMASALIQLWLGAALFLRPLYALLNAQSKPMWLGRATSALSIAAAFLGVAMIVVAFLFNGSGLH
jgi:hypothetical protein